jgi:hypothetical protein
MENAKIARVTRRANSCTFEREKKGTETIVHKTGSVKSTDSPRFRAIYPTLTRRASKGSGDKLDHFPRLRVGLVWAAKIGRRNYCDVVRRLFNRLSAV